MKRAFEVLVLTATVFLTSCASFPSYQSPPEGPGTAVIDISRIPANTLCRGGEFYKIPKVRDGKLVVATDTRVALHSFVYISDYMMNYSCAPGISFKPDPGATYLMNLETDGNRCWMEVYRKGATNPIGLDVESTAGDARYCR